MMLEIKNIHLNHHKTDHNNSDKRRYFDVQQEIRSANCHGFWRNFGLDGLSATRIHCHFERDTQIRFKVSEDMIVLCFILEGAVRARVDDREALAMEKGLQNICYMPPISGDLLCPCGCHNAFYVRMPIDLFKTYLPDIPPSCNNFHQQTRQGDFLLLQSKHGHVTHKMYAIIDDICHDKSDQKFHNLFLKAKLIELVSAQLEHLCTHPAVSNPLNKETVDKMYVVRDFILDHLGDYYSLKTLATKAGTNEHTLKKEFKELFGKTVFGFWSDAKMAKAQEMLLTNEKTVKQVSEAIGYKNPQHFSTAFKKKFNLSPSVFQKKNIQ